MTFREQYIQLHAKIAEIEKQREELRLETIPLEIKEEEVIKGVILEEKLLSSTEWVLEDWGNNVGLVADGSPKDFEKLSDLVRTSWHCSFKLEDGVTLNYDDNTISVSFKKKVSIKDFISKHGLKVELSPEVVKKLQETKDQLESLKGLL